MTSKKAKRKGRSRNNNNKYNNNNNNNNNHGHTAIQISKRTNLYWVQKVFGFLWRPISTVANVVLNFCMELFSGHNRLADISLSHSFNICICSAIV